jgi:hypothetical protein
MLTVSLYLYRAAAAKIPYANVPFNATSRRTGHRELEGDQLKGAALSWPGLSALLTFRLRHFRAAWPAACEAATS